jgi:hypothetical protein
VQAEKPDLVVLQGDQTYFHESLSYGFLELVYSMHRVTRDIPTIVLMDDHDYGEPNLWGAGDGDEDSGSGFTKPVCLINALQKQAMGHNPDSVHNGTLENGIDVYYTQYRYGHVDFAVLEARKFKNVADGDSLLGHEQEQWLQEWCSVNQDRVKVVLSQTPFASLATHNTIYHEYKPFGVHPIVGGEPDTNGYPVSGRNRFMDIIKGCSNLILSGDQHLGLAATYEDYGVTDCVSPAVINTIFWRLNLNAPGESYHDDYGHEYRLLNDWNVEEDLWRLKNPDSMNFTNSDQTSRADGFMMVDLDGRSATCSMQGYRKGSEQIWSVNVSAVSPPGASQHM